MHSSASGDSRFRVGDWIADPALDVVRRDAQSVKLEPRTMRVLQYLAARPLQVISQAELEAAVWKGVVVTPQSVYQSIAHLRRVFGDDARSPTYIETVTRKGYRLVAAVGPVAEAAIRPSVPVADATTPANTPPASATPATTPPALASSKRSSLRIWLGVLAAAGITALLIFGVRTWNAARAPQFAAIAVLPFTDLSPDQSNLPFCDGLTVELMSLLAQIPELRVIARNSAFAYRTREADPRKIGKELGVSHVLEGSVRREGTHVRITATLVETKSGFQILSRVFDRPTGEILRIQEEIARDVVDSLRIRLSADSSERIGRSVTTDVSAYELYLLGRYHQLQRTPEALNRAIRYHEEAIGHDPRFALAYAGLADAQMARYYYENRPLVETARAVEAAVSKALQLDPQLAEAHAAHAVLRMEQQRSDEAIADLEKAVALKPNYAEALIRLAAAREYRGEQRQALAALDQAQDLDPLHFILHIRRCLVLQNLGRYDDASKACQRATELDPAVPNGHWTTGLLALAQGDMVGAIAGYRRALQKAPWRTDLQTQLGWLLLDVGSPAEALTAFDAALVQKSTDPTYTKLERARWYVATASHRDLANYLAEVEAASELATGMQLEAAQMEIVAQQIDQGCARAQRAEAADAEDPQFQIGESVWDARWGRNDLLTLAYCAQRRDDAGAAEAHLQRLTQWLAQLEKNGNVWHGLHYLRASALAMRSRADDSLRELDKAVNLGWRRAWWMRSDPAFEELRKDDRFLTLIARIEGLNAATRAAMARTAPAPPGNAQP